MEFLKGWSESELRRWFEHPFWKAVEVILAEQIKRNEEDLLVGDIDIRTEGQEGFMYRNNEQLRGGIIAMRNAQDRLKLDVYLALEDAQTEASIQKEEE